MRTRWLRKIMSIGLIAFASVALAEVTVNFPVTDNILRNLMTVTLDFSVDGSGNVTLDASTSNAGTAPADLVDTWDNTNSVGTVANAAFFNTNFSLTAVAKLNGSVINELQTNGDQTEGLFVKGSAAINNAGDEELVMTYTGPGALSFAEVIYTNRVANGDSNLTFEDGDTRAEYMLPNTSTGGTIDLSGEEFSLTDSDSFIVTTDDLKDDGTPMSLSLIHI